MTDFLIAIGIIVVIMVIGVALQTYWDDERSKALLEASKALNLEFIKEDAGGEQRKQLTNFPIFNMGRGREIKNMMKGQAQDINVMLFDYEYTTGSGKQSHRYKQTIAHFESNRLQTPFFELCPENFLVRIGHALGEQDIDFDNFPRFSKQYQLKGDEALVRKYFNESRLQYFTSHQGWKVEGNGNKVVVMKFGKRAKPEELSSFMEQSLAVFNILAEG